MELECVWYEPDAGPVWVWSWVLRERVACCGDMKWIGCGYGVGMMCVWCCVCTERVWCEYGMVMLCDLSVLMLSHLLFEYEVCIHWGVVVVFVPCV